MPSVPPPSPPAYRLVRRAAPRAAPLVLDERQREVVDHAAGPLLVLAGPGTGKTATMVEAVAARIEAGVEPEKVLVLTFSRKAAAELRLRLAARVGQTIRRPLALTFHSYAFALLRRDAASRGEPAPRLLTGPEQDLIIRELLRGDVADGGSAWPPELRPALLARGFAQELRDLLLRAVERGISPEELHVLGERLGRDDWRAAAAFFQQYLDVTTLAQARAATAAAAYDPAELVRAAVDLLDGDVELAAAERDAYTWVFVDEYQDTDPAQEALLHRIAGGGRNLVVVGDPDQSIYAFRGADVSCIREFGERFRPPGAPPVPVVALSTCRRSGPELLAATRRVSDRLRGPAAHRERHAAPGLAAGSAEAHVLRSESQQAAYIAHRLRHAHLMDGVPWHRMAVLVRSATQQLPALRRALASAGVPVTLGTGDIPLAQQGAVAALLTALRGALALKQRDDDIAAADERDGEALPARRPLNEDDAVELLSSPIGGADVLALRRLRRELRRQELTSGGWRSSGELLVEALGDPRALLGVTDRHAEPARRVAQVLQAGREAAAAPGASAELVLWAIWTASGLGPRWQQASVVGGARGASADRDLDAVVALFDAAARFVDRMPGAGPAIFLDYMGDQAIASDTLAASAPTGDAVRILTSHSSKGLEWEVVVVAGVQEGQWPDLRMRGSLLGSEQLVDVVAARDLPADAQRPSAMSQLLDEERRLFYVAATRAKRSLIVTAVDGDDDQPSRFLDELCPRPGEDHPRPPTEVPRLLSLPALVAELRGVLLDQAQEADTGRRAAAAAQLARLAQAAVPGADPATWWGLLPVSDERPLREATESVRVSPSRVEQFVTCELRWLLEQAGGTDSSSADQSIGTAVHALAQLAADESIIDEAVLSERLDAVWSSLDLGARWFSRKERERAQIMVRKLVSWLKDNPRALVEAEVAFEVEVGRAVVKGRVDRLEQDADGRLVVIDLKTGKSAPKAEELAAHPQLGVYQLAVEAGGFEEVAPGLRASGGASLVQVGTSLVGYKEQWQGPLAESQDPGWARNLVVTVAEGMAGSAFRAMENRNCQHCPVRRCCPVQPEGRTVTG